MAENHHSDPKQPSLGWRDAAGGAIILLALMIGFYWKLALTRQYTWFDHPDMAYLEIPRLQFEASQIHSGHFPLWDPHIWSGQPFIGQTQPGPLFPFNILFSLYPLQEGYIRFAALNWYWVLIHWLAAWFSYLLVRDLGLSRMAGLVAGVLFACGGFLGTVAWLDVVNGAIWIPLVMLFVLRAVRRVTTGERAPWRDVALGGVLLGVAWLSGHHELPILLSLACAVLWIRGRRVIPYALTFFAIAILVSCIQALPTYEFGRLSRRWLGLAEAVTWKDKIPYITHTIYSLPPRGILAIFVPGFGRFADASPYLGLIPMALAVLAIATRWRDWTVRRLTLLGALALIYAMGAFTPLNGVMYALLPVVDKARIPMRAIAIADFAIIVLAAAGLETLLTRQSPLWTRRLRWFLAVAGVLLVTLQLTAKDSDDRLLLAALLALAASALLAGFENKALSPAVLGWSLLGLLVIDLTQAGPAFYNHRQDKEGDKFLKTLTQHRDIAGYLRNLPGQPVRIHVDDQANGANFGDWHGIDMLYGYVAGASLNVSEQELHTKRTQDLFAVTHFVGKQPDKPQQMEVFSGVDGLKVFRNPDAFPRVRAVHDAHSVPSIGHLRLAIQDPQNDLLRTAYFIGPAPQLESCEGQNEVRLTQYSTDDITISAELPCRELVVLAETMYPGWQATVDGKPAKMWEAYGVFRSVVVDAGKHEVRMQFRPRSVYWGAGLTLLGLAAAAALCLL